MDSTSGVTITPISASSNTGASVQVTFGPSICSDANPTMSISPLQSQYVTSGTPVNFIVSVKNNDSSGCPATTFNLSDTLPHWLDRPVEHFGFDALCRHKRLGDSDCHVASGNGKRFLQHWRPRD